MTSHDPFRVHFFTLTDTRASEHVYMGELKDALTERDVEAVEDWREADVVHLFEVNFYTRAAISQFQYPKLLRVLNADVPVVVSTDDLFFIDEPEITAKPGLYHLNQITQRWLFGQADAIIAISESVQSALEDHVGRAKLSVVHHGVTEEYYTDREPENPPFVFHVSIASERKNPEAIVETAQRLDAPFVVAGGGWEEHFEDADDVDNVDVRGYVPESELIELYKDAAVFYFPTLHEGFGLPLLEAMAANTAVVTSDAYAVPEVVGDAAITRDAEAVDAHVASIRGLLESDRRRQDLATQARDRARAFTWDRAAEETTRVYSDVRRERPPPQ